MADLVISSLQGGLNEDDPVTIADDQCSLANNVEFFKAKLGRRRGGSAPIDMTGSPFGSSHRVVWLHRHLPTTDPRDAQLWAIGVQDPSTVVLAYKDTAWHTVAMSDAMTIDGVSEYQVQGVSLHGKLFIAYNSAVDRLHVWDGTSLRRAGIAEPAVAPTAANSGGVGTLAGVRYYRVRYIAKSGSIILRRSEPSPSLTFTPGGANVSVTVTKPAAPGEGETHWELEASLDDANYYVIATTVVATATATDSVDYNTGYPASGFDTLSEDSGDYEPVPSIKLLTTDDDRLICGGSWEDSALASRVFWTPVNADPGVGNDERIPVDSNNYKDLDNKNGGGLTGLSTTVNGYIYATKETHVYQLARTGQRTRAYEDRALTKERGAIFGSLVTAFDQGGNPTPFFLDPDIGPCRIGPRGVEPCGADVQSTWGDVSHDASHRVCCSVYYPARQQVIWNVATLLANTPTRSFVLHTQFMRNTSDGLRGGWALWDGVRAEAICMCLFASNINDNTARSRSLVPFMGVEDTGYGIQYVFGGVADVDLSGVVPFSAKIRTKAFARRNLLTKFECRRGVLVANAAAGKVVVAVNGNYGVSGLVTTSEEINLAGPGGVNTAITPIDNLGLADITTVQVEFSDPASANDRSWVLQMFALKDETGQRP